MYYAIEQIGYDKRTRFCIKEVRETGLTIPVDGKTYRTAEAARAAAEALGLKIERIGDLWEII